MTAGIIGVPLGSYLSTNYIKRCPRIDPMICAVGLLVSAPLLAFAIFFITESPLAAYIAIFFGQVALNCNWAVVADMLLVRFLTQFCKKKKLCACLSSSCAYRDSFWRELYLLHLFYCFPAFIYVYPIIFVADEFIHHSSLIIVYLMTWRLRDTLLCSWRWWIVTEEFLYGLKVLLFQYSLLCVLVIIQNTYSSLC